MLAIQTILHPTDFSAPAEYAFRLACSLARDHGARLIVLHVKPIEVLYTDSLYVMPPDPAQVEENLLEQLHELKPPEPLAGVDYLLREGNPVLEILRIAQESGCDLIVMGTHGRTGLRRLLVGSVAEQVLRKAGCPVLTVKAPSTLAESAHETTVHEVMAH
jgi:nucleotide-binding universal stress UspA family protein